jgi:hypothetical protein
MSGLTFLTQDLWSTLMTESTRSDGIAAAVAYVTNVDDVPFRSGDILVLDASDEAIRAGKTSAIILEELLHRGVLLYSCHKLHAKVYAFEDAVIVGSSNLSSSSRRALIECAAFSRDTTLITEVRNWICNIASRSVGIDQSFVDQAKGIVIEKPEALHQPGSPRLWYLAVSPNALSKNMRAYFVALVIAQIGALEAERPFRLWPSADFRQHEKKGRLRREGFNFILSHRGVDYFSQPRERPKDDLLKLFLTAVLTGDSSALPEGVETSMRPMLADRWVASGGLE